MDAADSLHVAGLKVQLTTASGADRIDLLNDLAREYKYLKKYADSVNKYAKAAYEGAKKMNYNHGMALSLLLMPGTKEEELKFKGQAFDIATKISDHAVLGWYYYGSPTGDQYEDFTKSVEQFKISGDIDGEAEVSTWLTMMLIYIGKYEEALPYAERNLKITGIPRKHSVGLQHVLSQLSYNNMADLYRAAGDFSTALDYLHKARASILTHNDDGFIYRVIAQLHIKMANPDSAIYYSGIDQPVPPVLGQFGEAYLLKGDYQKSLEFANRAIDSILLPRVKPFYRYPNGALSGLYFTKAKVFTALKDYKQAMEHMKKADGYRATGDLDFQMDRLKYYSEIYHHMDMDDSAFSYLKKYVVLRDSVESKKSIWLLNLKLNRMQSSSIDARNEAALTLKEAKIEQQVVIRNGLAGGLILLLLTGFFMFRTLNLKRRNERLSMQKNLIESDQKQSELLRKAVEQEMQMLRAQMNPHFIFNCLSSINRFIFKNDSRAASDYLTRFSRLIRMVLVNSQKRLISLEDELEMLKLYLDMERMRFKDGFDYSVTTNNGIDAGAIFIPPLLLQPFCENAIWHGLMHKDGKGRLNISITDENNVLFCTITDDGVGREKAGIFRSKSAEKEKSLGLSITSSRLSILNGIGNNETAYNIEDIKDEGGHVAGTRVNLKIHYKESMEVEQYA